MGTKANQLQEMRKKNVFDQKKQEKESFKEQLNSFRSNIDLLNDRLRILSGDVRTEPQVINQLLEEIHVEETARDLYRKSMGDKLKLNLYDDARRVIIEAEEKKRKGWEGYMKSRFGHLYGAKEWETFGGQRLPKAKGSVADEQSNWSGYEY